MARGYPRLQGRSCRGRDREIGIGGSKRTPGQCGEGTGRPPDGRAGSAEADAGGVQGGGSAHRGAGGGVGAGVGERVERLRGLRFSRYR